MKAKLALIVLGLIVLPTAILSLLASMALRDREATLMRSIEVSARGSIDVFSLQVRNDLDGELDRVRTAMSDCISRNAKSDEIISVVSGLRNTRPLVRQVYLFVNPFGFLYPDEAPGGDSQTGRDARPGLDPLVAGLRREIAGQGDAGRVLRLTVNDASYCFTAIRDRKDLYVGYEVNMQGLATRLAGMIAARSQAGIELRAETPGLLITREGIRDSGGVVVNDSLGIASEAGIQEGGRPAGYLAEGRLPRPVDHVRLTALLGSKGGMEGATAFRPRLYGWGILLLAVAIIAGAGFILRESLLEVRHARARSDFVVGVSHDLRTPVSSMKMLAESLYLDHVREPAQQKRFMGTIVRECERLSQLIERVLFFVRLGQDALVYHRREIAPGELVAAAVKAFQSRIGMAVEEGSAGAIEIIGDGKKNLSETSPLTRPVPNTSALHRSGAPTLSVAPGLPMILADESAMTQVILNLLDNAWKYGVKRGEGRGARDGESEVRGGEAREKDAEFGSHNIGNEGRASEDPIFQCSNIPVGIVPEISVRIDVIARARWFVGPERKWVRIAVEDHGMGIERNQLRKVFRSFYRSPAARESNLSGVGLGLALCKHIVTGHGGWIEVESEEGKGSTFSVYVPAEGKGI